jgi:very-short-patch-repair endonuclease
MTRRDIDSALAALAERQFGVVGRRQLAELVPPVSSQYVVRRCHAGAWRVVAPGVYVREGSPHGWHQQLMVAWLHAGPSAAVSHESAAALWGFSGYPRQPVVVSVAHPAHHRPAVGRVHHPTDLTPDQIIARHNLAVTTPARTLCDVAAEVPLGTLARVLDDALASKTVTVGALNELVARLLRPGKRGVPRLARLLEERGPGFSPPASELERLLRFVVRASGVPGVVYGADFPGRRAVGSTVDAAIPAARIVLEADGRRWHQRVDDMLRDRERDNEAARHGWVTLRFMYESLLDPLVAVAQLADTYAARRELFQAADGRSAV